MRFRKRIHNENKSKYPEVLKLTAFILWILVGILLAFGFWCIFETISLRVSQTNYLKRTKGVKHVGFMDGFLPKFGWDRECVSSEIETLSSNKRAACLCNSASFTWYKNNVYFQDDLVHKTKTTRNLLFLEKPSFVSFYSCDQIEGLYLKVAAIDFFVVCIILLLWLSLKRARLKVYQTQYHFFIDPYLRLRNLV